MSFNKDNAREMQKRGVAIRSANAMARHELYNLVKGGAELMSQTVISEGLDGQSREMRAIEAAIIAVIKNCIRTGSSRDLQVLIALYLQNKVINQTQDTEIRILLDDGKGNAQLI